MPLHKDVDENRVPYSFKDVPLLPPPFGGGGGHVKFVGEELIGEGEAPRGQMAGGEEKSGDFYAVLGLKKECTASELRDAYKKLALRWHPDRCSEPGNSKSVEESKKKFQAIQHAYSVLSDENKRFLYDVGVYESDDDESGMGEFLSEMAVMMSQNNSNENGEESLEELQELFDEMFQGDIEAFASTSRTLFTDNNIHSTSSSRSSFESCRAGPDSSNKRNSVEKMRGGNDRWSRGKISRSERWELEEELPDSLPEMNG